MARKLDKALGAKKSKSKTAAPAGEDDLAIMHPDVTMPIGGLVITVREYGMVEGIRVRAQLKGFSQALMALFEQGEALTEDIMDVIAEHFAEVRVAIAVSTLPDDATPDAIEDRVAWMRTLSDAEGDLLLNTWWGVCGPFFVRQVLRRLLERLRRKAPDGLTSTSSSSTPASAPLSSSDVTPPASSSSSASA